MIPCDLDESEDYVCISLLEDDEKNDESESSITSSNTSSPARNPVLRTKSSPHKKPEQEEEEEVSSLTRSYSGPMIRGNRPRSRAFLGKRLSDRYDFLSRDSNHSEVIILPIECVLNIQSYKRSYALEKCCNFVFCCDSN